jgi:hypothetical protein
MARIEQPYSLKRVKAEIELLSKDVSVDLRFMVSLLGRKEKCEERMIWDTGQEGGSD